MKTYISILRGINVGGHKKLKMDDLRNMYEKLGFKNVKTYIQSGNVVFQNREISCKELEHKISTEILKLFSIEVPVIVISQIDMEIIYANNPFVNNQNKEISTLHTTFFSHQPEKSEINKISGDFGNDEYIFTEKAVYVYCPDGYGNSKLTNSFFETKLRITATTRNWKTVSELVQTAKSIA